MSKFDKFRDYIWYNGELVKPEDAKLSVMAHTMHYGSGFFEGIRGYKTVDGKTAIFRLEEHAKRLVNSVKLYNIEMPFSKEEIMKACLQVVKENKFDDCYIRPLYFLGEGFSTIEITEETAPNMMVSAWELDYRKSAVKLSVSSHRRFMSSQAPMQAKAIGNYMNSWLIREEAYRKGDHDGIALDMQGYVSEVSTANIFIVKDGVIITPDMSSSILNGITRQSVITIAKDLGYEVIERKVARDELHLADEIFITGTASEVKSCSHLDSRVVGNGEYPISEKLAKVFFEAVRGENENYKGWLTYVE